MPALLYSPPLLDNAHYKPALPLTFHHNNFVTFRPDMVGVKLFPTPWYRTGTKEASPDLEEGKKDLSLSPDDHLVQTAPPLPPPHHLSSMGLTQLIVHICTNSHGT